MNQRRSAAFTILGIVKADYPSFQSLRHDDLPLSKRTDLPLRSGATGCGRRRRAPEGSPLASARLVLYRGPTPGGHSDKELLWQGKVTL